jgi:Domain of unknown function (DUF2427)
MVGVMLGVAQSPFHIPVQIVFLTLTTIGIVLAIVYNSATPDFYENNAHHKIGWVIIWMLIAQVVAGLIRGVARYVNGDISSRHIEISSPTEGMFMLGGEDDDEDSDATEIKDNGEFRRKSSESGDDRVGSTSSNAYVHRRSSENTLLDDREQNLRAFERRPRNAETQMESFLAKRLRGQGWVSRISRQGAWIARIIHGAIGRPMWCLGFIQLCTGVVTVTGIFKGSDLWNGLAHFIKGSDVC